MHIRKVVLDMKVYKCEYCKYNVIVSKMDKDNHSPKYKMGLHYHTKHKNLIPFNMTGFQWFYYKLTGKDHGSCIICKNNTTFNETAMKYSRFCQKPNCKEKYRDEFKSRMIKKYGKIHLLNDPDKQKEMLANRSISGKYLWRDGSIFTYTGSYELDFLQFLDLEMKWKSSDVMAPSPHTFMYEYGGKDHFYIPDVFIPSLNLIVEVKDGGEAKQISDESRMKDKIKIDLMKSNTTYFDFILLTNKDYSGFLEFIKEE